MKEYKIYESKVCLVWVSIYENTDKEGGLVNNVVMGLLSAQYSKWILLHCDVPEMCNKKTAIKLLAEALANVRRQGIIYENVLFFISDASTLTDFSSENVGVTSQAPPPPEMMTPSTKGNDVVDRACNFIDRTYDVIFFGDKW